MFQCHERFELKHSLILAFGHSFNIELNNDHIPTLAGGTGITKTDRALALREHTFEGRRSNRKLAIYTIHTVRNGMVADCIF